MPAEELPLTVSIPTDAGGPDHKQWLVTPKGKGLVRQKARSGAQAQATGVLRITRISDECVLLRTPARDACTVRCSDVEGVSLHVQGQVAWRSRTRSQAEVSAVTLCRMAASL
jgi:hypothetical protein